MKRTPRLLVSFALWLCVAFAAEVAAQPLQARNARDHLLIVAARDASLPEQIAAQEVRRYLYLRTNWLVPLVFGTGELPSTEAMIVIGSKDRSFVKAAVEADSELAESVASLKPQQYRVKATEYQGRKAVVIGGGDAIGTLYGAYRFAETLGVRFYLHGDVVPDEQVTLGLPYIDERGVPLFATRGIQPFHDFPEGPDWWNENDYKAVLAQLPKLRMNFFGLHTYPEGGVGPEPTVWIGLRDDVNADGTVGFSSQSSYQNTLRGNWGYVAKKTSDFSFGSAQLFERDDYGPDVMRDMIPWPETADERNSVFNNTGRMLKGAFTFAHALGIETCVGTETPLIVPEMVKERIAARGKDPNDPAVIQEVYEGMFQRITKAYPLDYYWFWTPESWTWGNPKDEEVDATVADLKAALAAIEKVGSPFTLATCGWVLGPPKDRALFDNLLPKEMPMSCINRNVGFAPVETGFARVEGRPQWAIPWLEDDPALIIPQLWVGRMRRDAADALGYGCTGLLGIHWRTRPLAPNVSALAKAAWRQKPWNPQVGEPVALPEPKSIEGRDGGNVSAFPDHPIADTEHDSLYQTVAYGMTAYRLKVPDGKYEVRLQLCEPHYREAGKRIFGVTLEDKKVIDDLDVFAAVGQNRALDYAFEGVAVSDGMLEIRFDSIVEYPCIAAFVVQGPEFTKKINCGGPAYEDYQADLPATESNDGPRDLPTEDFYLDWAWSQFGPSVAQPSAALFARLDGGANMGLRGQGQTNLPRPATWVGGPGGIRPDVRPWSEVAKEYAFVDEMAALRPHVKGAGYLERFDYWLNTFRYLRAVGQVNCMWARFNEVMERVKKEQDRDAQQKLAREAALPIRKALIQQVGRVHELLLATITTTGGMGTVANWQQHLLPSLLTEPGKELAAILGEPLPADAAPATTGGDAARIVVPTVRTVLMADEDLSLKAVLVNSGPSADAVLRWRPLGRGRFNQTPLKHVARSVYTVTLPAAQFKAQDFEYYIAAKSSGGDTLVFPATAPRLNQTVIVTRAN
ncbi:MAG: hypothetical protein JSW27_23320 [Phycisphaerales bacterium]|nr:MAG: hypothetical protein JSW27_23320 [Phycisphaerales bacterium]